MKAKSIWMTALWVAGMGAAAAFPGCQKEPSSVAAADRAAADKAAADRAAADKAAADKAAADRAAADKAAADKTTADKTATDKTATDKTAADKAAADKAAADKAAAEKSAALDKAEASTLPPDLVEMKAEITRMTAQIDLTMAKLDTLMASTGDLDKPTEAAQAAIKALETEAQILKQRGDQMRDRGAAYFEVWEKQLASMTTPEVAAIATKRKEELAKKYSEVLLAMQETRAALDSYLGDMKTIRTAVDDGMTPERQKLVAPQVKAAKDKAATLKTRVEATFTKLSQVSQIYAQR